IPLPTRLPVEVLSGPPLHACAAARSGESARVPLTASAASAMTPQRAREFARRYMDALPWVSPDVPAYRYERQRNPRISKKRLFRPGSWLLRMHLSPSGET